MTMEISKECQDALDGDPTASLAMWRDVAGGRFYPETRMWLQIVAERIIEATLAGGPPNRKPDRITQAVGLKGRQDENAQERETAEVLRDFGLTQTQVLEWMVREGHIKPGPDGDDLDKVKGWLRKKLEV